MAQESQKEDIIPGHSTIDDFTKHAFKILVEATKSSNALPTERDWDYYKVYESFNKILQCESDKVSRLMNNILHTQQLNANIRSKDLEEKTEIIIEANDDILEKVALGIDEMNGIKRSTQNAIEIQTVSAQLPVNGSWNQLNKATFSVSSSLDTTTKQNNALKSIRLLTAKNIVRPQMLFKDKIDNSNNHPWIPRITEKPNSIKPLAIFLEETAIGEMYTHPYEFELDHFQPSVDQLRPCNPRFPKPLEETPLFEISTAEQLNDLLEELRKHKEFAVDLEHHSYRTFMGITCLMQISTADCDYLIDTFTLRDKLCILNEVFTKPSIVKVFHGADSDIEWLQRDLSLYIVNMFDTHQAAKQLEYSGLSLAFLMNRFCNIVPNKHFQLADWRIRPLPDELKLYARMDTHYLLYIYQMLKNALIQKGNGSHNILKSVIQQSTHICQKRYMKPLLHEESHLDFYRKCKRLFDNRQMYALKELYRWRDTLARTEDESTGYILPNHMLLQVSQTLPREMQGILACCNPIPPLVRANLLELHRIILRAREQSIVKPILKEDVRSRGSTLKFTKINVDSPLHCPHDLTKQIEFGDNLPTLLRFDGGDVRKNNSNGERSPIKIEKMKSMYSVFNTPDNSADEDDNEAVLKKHNITFLDPYARYKLVKPFIQAEEEKAAAERKIQEDSKSPDKSTDERIAALHEHFVKVSKETPQKMRSPGSMTEESNKYLPPKNDQETLSSMGASKKRKHEDLYNNSDQFHPDFKKPCNELHTPIPNYKQNNLRKNKRSRRKNWKTANNEHPQNINQFPQSTGDAINFPQTRHFEALERSHNEPHCFANNQNSRGKKRKSNFNRKNATKSVPGNFAPNISQTHVQQPNTTNQTNNPAAKMSNKQRKRLEWNRRRSQNFKLHLKPSAEQIQQNSFTPFDYSSVNFESFQGGAASSRNINKPVNAKFKGKNKNKKFNRKPNNKSVTFDRPNK